MSLLSKKTLTKKLLTSKTFREAFVWEHIKRSLPFQVRTMRDEREWSQEKAAEMLGKTQSVISRYESPAGASVNLQTLLEIAHGFDVGLLIKFVPFSRLVREYEDVSHFALSAKSVSDETEAASLGAWATAPASSTTSPIVMSGPGTGKSASILSTLGNQTFTITLDIPRKQSVISPSAMARGTHDDVVTVGEPKVA